ncbi:MAG: iron-containing alcohol dehydrogenase [Acidobacteria bacterium]|nr:iron-containing alcohol dehydrogenase [Acidobacteriota bacterium]
MRAFRLPTRVVLEAGCLSRLGEALAFCARKAHRVLLVSDPGLADTPWPKKAAALLRSAGIAAVESSDVEPNPRAATVEALSELARQHEVGAVVGLGGGSVLDAAKAAAMLAVNGGRIEDYEGAGKFTEGPLPFVAVPSTCGTGSEVTWVSVISVEERRAKISVKGDGMFPDVALVDADLLSTMPPHLVAWTGVDALTHALEALTVKLANPASDALAARAVALITTFLPRAVAGIASDAESRQAMARASTLAGMAFGNADVGAVHCLSETLGGLYDVPHGLANAVLLEPVLRSHGSSVEAPLAQLARQLGWSPLEAPDDTAAQAALARVQDLVRELAIPDFSSLGVSAEDFPEVARRAVANGSNPSNPRPMGEAEYLKVLQSL